MTHLEDKLHEREKNVVQKLIMEALRFSKTVQEGVFARNYRDNHRNNRK